MGITELLALIVPLIVKYGPAAESAVASIVSYVARLSADNTQKTTGEEVMALNQAIADLDKSDAAFDAAFADVGVPAPAQP